MQGMQREEVRRDVKKKKKKSGQHPAFRQAISEFNETARLSHFILGSHSHLPAPVRVESSPLNPKSHSRLNLSDHPSEVSYPIYT